MASNDDQFLGGGVAFNKVGNHPTGDEVAKVEAPRVRPHHVWNILWVSLLVIMAVVLYLVGEAGLIPGIQHTHTQVRHKTDDTTHGFESQPTINVDKPLTDNGS